MIFEAGKNGGNFILSDFLGGRIFRWVSDFVKAGFIGFKKIGFGLVQKSVVGIVQNGQ